MNRFLTILEVSQKQAYIFASNKLQDNIRRSSEIAVITGIPFMQETIDKSNTSEIIILKDHLIYSGGGHTVLEFDSESDARHVVNNITARILNDFPEIEMFASTVKYDELKTPGENIKDLIKKLEAKKSFRVASFHQGTFGIEKIDPNTGKPEMVLKNRNEILSEESWKLPEGLLPVSKFEDLGGDKGENNFIAVIHIDGNAMGKRVEEITSSCKVGEWEEYKRKMHAFSKGIKDDFSAAYKEMEQEVAEAVINGYWLNTGMLKEIPFKKKGNDIYFPVRRIINEGDDVCFVTEGRIGIACAAEFLRKLSNHTNEEDGKKYAACAGIAIVHQKYPFYRAYELAEELCNNAKKFGVTLGSKVIGMGKGVEVGSQASCIDWHLEYGELQDSLEETRVQYETGDRSRLELRPYLVNAPKELEEAEPIRQYRNFEKLMDRILKSDDFYASGTMKRLRSVLKKGNDATVQFLKYHKIESLGRDGYLGIYSDPDYQRVGTGKGQERMVFKETTDGKRRSLIFDAIEVMDTYLPIKEETE